MEPRGWAREARSLLALVGLAVLAGCSFVNAPDSHTRARTVDAGQEPVDALVLDAADLDAARVLDASRDAAPDALFAPDAGPTDAGLPDAGPADASLDAPLAPLPRLRIVHLARDTAAVDVYAGDTVLASSLGFAALSGESRELPAGAVALRVTRAGSSATLIERTFDAQRGREYTLAIYGDETMPPFGDRTLDLLWLDDDASGLDVLTDIRLAAVHVATPVRAGQLVAVRPDEGNLLLADSFAFRAVAPLTLAAAAYVVGFDAGADGVVDLEFAVPALVPGTYANVFVATRPDDSVFLFVTSQRGAAVVIDPIPTAQPRVRVAHLARDTDAVDVYANGELVASSLDFASVSMPRDVAPPAVAIRVTRAGGSDPIVERSFPAALGGEYTLAVYGDEDAPPFGDRALDLLWLDDDASGLDTRTDIRLAAIHVASNVVAGQLVAVRPTGNLLLADEFAFRAVAPLTLPSMPYVVGFDAGADGVVDVEFAIPSLVPGTYANVFVASRSDDSVFLLVNTRRGATLVIDPR